MSLEAILNATWWSGLTLACYVGARALYRRYPHWWLMPLLVTPVMIGAVLVATDTHFAAYHAGTGWLMLMLGPSVTAFAVPIYDQRSLILRCWRELLIGMTAGSVAALSSCWALASLLGIDGVLRLTLMPRSISTPFAIQLAQTIGGVPEVTATFVIVTGVGGALMGEWVLARGLVRSTLAKGAMFGVAAHAAGSAHALRLDSDVGAIAGLTMVLTGVLNLLAAPLIALVLS